MKDFPTIDGFQTYLIKTWLIVVLILLWLNDINKLFSIIVVVVTSSFDLLVQSFS